jgi:hypothetical protein
VSKPQQCPICKVEAQILDNSGGSWKIICPRCGNFSIGWQARPPNEYFDTTQIANLSGWIREHQSYVFSVSDMAGLRALRTPTVGEKAEKILLYFAHKYPKPGELIRHYGLLHFLAELGKKSA